MRSKKSWKVQLCPDGMELGRWIQSGKKALSEKSNEIIVIQEL